MTQSIEEVRGIGPATAEMLAESGIKTAADLAGKTVAEVAALKGFSDIRAEQVIVAAQSLIGDTLSAEPVKTKSKKNDSGKKSAKKADKNKKMNKKSEKALKKDKKASKSKKKIKDAKKKKKK